MSNRQDIAFLTPFANDAETTLPGVPINGTSYRNPAFTALGPGWPYKTKVKSQDFNQVMYVQTLLMRQLSNQGVLDYSDKEDYTANNALVKDDGGLYLCVVDNGPASAVKQPSTEPLFWRRIDITEVSPLNNTWNGYLDPEHQSSLPAPNGYPGNSGGGKLPYDPDDEISYGIRAGSGGAVVSSDSDGWIFTGSIYRLHNYTAAQLADIDVNAVSVYLKGQDGSEYFVNNATAGVNVTKPDATTLKVEITGAIFATLGITKLWRWFDTERAGRVVELSPAELIRSLLSQLMLNRKILNVGSSRLAGVQYTNSNPYPIVIYVTGIANASGSDFNIQVKSDVVCQITGDATSNYVGTGSVTIQPGDTYQVNATLSSVLRWFELR